MLILSKELLDLAVFLLHFQNNESVNKKFEIDELGQVKTLATHRFPQQKASS